MSGSVETGAASGVPDFTNDEAVIAAYESAKLRYIRALTQDAETQLRESFARKREALSADVETLRALCKTREEEASAAAARYATRLPHRVRKSGVRPPSPWERIATLNAVGALYRAAADAADAFDDVNDALHKKHAQLDALDRDLRRSLYLREEAARKKLQTPEGVAALHADPQVRTAYVKVQAVMREREAYDRRVERGEVTPAEARDREMTQRGQTFAAVPLTGAILARIATYGPLAYYVVRDLTGAESLLAFDPSLEPLRDLVFDLIAAGGGYEAMLRHTADGVPMRVFDHLRATRSPEDAADLYALHRASLRSARPKAATPARDATESAMIGMLRLLAEAVAAHGAAEAEPEDA